MVSEVPLSSVVQRVEVYRSQALVTRRAWARVPPADGRLTCILEGLPLGLVEGSVRLERVRPQDAHLLDLHLGWSIAPRDGRLLTGLQAQLRDLVCSALELSVARDREQDRIRLLRSFQPAVVPASQMPEALAFEARHQTRAWLDLAAWISERVRTAQHGILELERKQRDLLDQLARVRDELGRESRAEQEALAHCRKVARIQLEVGGRADEVELHLSYLVTGARWVPEYELRVLEGPEEAELVLGALVAQRTGESWNETELAFSTADLQRSSELPELCSWRIGRAQPPRATGWRTLPEGLDDLFEGYDRGVQSLPAPQQISTPSLPEIPRLAASGQQQAVDEKQAAGRQRMDSSGSTSRSDPGPTRTRAVAHMIEEELGGIVDDEVTGEYEPDSMPAGVLLARAAPAPPARQDARPKKKQRKEEQDRRRSLPVPPQAAAAIQPLLEASAMDLQQTQVRGEGSEAEEEGTPPPVTLGISREALGYQDLRMQGPAAGGLRGQLRAVGPLDDLDPAAARPSLPAPDADSLGDLVLPQHAVSLECSAGHFATRYPMETLASVLPDGQLHTLTLLRRTGRVRRLYRCVPAVDCTVYQVAQLDNPLGLPLLAGPVRVYRGADFVVTAPLSTTGPGKTLTVNLGVEPGIVVARNVHFHESTEGLFKGDTALVHRIEIEVRSNLDFPARVELFERVPTSPDDDIKIEVLRTEPRAEAYDQAEREQLIRGGHRFTLELGPKEARSCTLEYRITIPSKQVLVGGNRRG